MEMDSVISDEKEKEMVRDSIQISTSSPNRQLDSPTPTSSSHKKSALSDSEQKEDEELCFQDLMSEEEDDEVNITDQIEQIQKHWLSKHIGLAPEDDLDTAHQKSDLQDGPKPEVQPSLSIPNLANIFQSNEEIYMSSEKSHNSSKDGNLG